MEIQAYAIIIKEDTHNIMIMTAAGEVEDTQERMTATGTGEEEDSQE